MQGRADAAITLVQYGDYECPYTRLSRHSIHQLQREFSNSLRFIFRHFPLEEIHPHARAASAAAEAAAQQTDFWTMHEHLFEHQEALEDADLQRYAEELGLDSSRFARDRTSPDIENRIDRDLDSGQHSGVPGTPTFHVNGIRLENGYDLESLRSAILAHIAGTEQVGSSSRVARASAAEARAPFGNTAACCRRWRLTRTRTG